MVKRLVLGLLALLLLGCNTVFRLATPPTPTTALNRAEADYAIYAGLIAGMYKLDTLDRLVIQDQTGMGVSSTEPSQLQSIRDSLPEVSQALLDDFAAQNAQPVTLQDRFNLSVNVVLIGQDEVSRLFGQSGSGWDEFYKRYPNSQGLMTLSRVGFNAQGDRALVYIGNQSHYLAGAGYAVVLGLKDGQWTILNQVMLWIS